LPTTNNIPVFDAISAGNPNFPKLWKPLTSI